MLLTDWYRPGGPKFPSQYGMVNYGEWCEKEVERLGDSGINAKVKRRRGLVCVWRTNKGLEGVK